MPLEPTNTLITKLNAELEPLLPVKAREALNNLYNQLLKDYLFLEQEHDSFVKDYEALKIRVDALESSL